MHLTIFEIFVIYIIPMLYSFLYTIYIFWWYIRLDVRYNWLMWRPVGIWFLISSLIPILNIILIIFYLLSWFAWIPFRTLKRKE